MRSMMRVSVRGVSERRTGFKDRDRRDLQHAPTAERWIGRLMKLSKCKMQSSGTDSKTTGWLAAAVLFLFLLSLPSSLSSLGISRRLLLLAGLASSRRFGGGWGDEGDLNIAELRRLSTVIGERRRGVIEVDIAS
mmetsp:Transcript_16050/g.32748  ORF Transcript_16050/g.32748 Transcript_16050/m.32748 type:complete len:135 (-) Transcript_16050:250-654(-)